MIFRNLTAAAVGGLIASLSLVSSAQATGDVWVEGSYEALALPDVRFVNDYFFQTSVGGVASQEFRNDDGDFDGFRIDGGISNIPIMGGAYMAGVKGFFAWHDDKSELQCTHPSAVPGNFCFVTPLTDNPAISQVVSVGGGSAGGNTMQFTTDREVNHWGMALEVVQGPMGLKAGPAFRRIDQDLTITSREISAGSGGPDPYQLTYREDLDTNYWGAFVGSVIEFPLGGGWSLQADGEAGLYWANTDYSGSYVVTNAYIVAGTLNPNVNQSLSLESDKLAFIGVLKAALEKDFDMFKLAGFGRVEYISSAPDVGYNELDIFAGGVAIQGPEEETRLGEGFAYTASVGGRVTVPLGSDQ